MGTKLKTVSYCFANVGPVVVAANAAQTITRTLYFPESGKTFRSATLDGSGDHSGGAAVDTNVRLLSLQIGSNTATTLNNAIRLTNSGEHYSPFIKQTVTAQFTSFWGADTTSLPVNATQQYNVNAGTAGNNIHNANMELHVTYEYDDTSATKIKTVMIPLDAPVANITTSNTTYDTIPALDTYLPEASKVYRNIYIVVQGNVGLGANANLHVLAGATGVTCAQITNNLASDRFFRVIIPFDSLDTSTTHNFQLGSSVTKMAHVQAYMVVTYEYDEASTTSIMNSVMLPMDIDSPAGYASGTWQRASRTLWIQEPGTITTNRVAYYVFWSQLAAIGGLNMRLGTGSFVAYSDFAAVLCGDNAAMVRNDSAFTLARGRNSLNFDVYRTDTADFMWNMSGFWLVNYTSSKPTLSDDANHTVRYSILGFGTAAATANTLNTLAPSIPETNYFITAIGTEGWNYSNTTTTIAGLSIQVQKTSGEGGQEWLQAYKDLMQTDPELGLYHSYSQVRDYFKRYPQEVDTSRLDLETSRAWHFQTFTTAGGAAGWRSLDLLFTYHTITYTVSGTVSGSGGGTVTLDLWRDSDHEKLLSTSRVGNGAYSFTWYDNTEPVFVTAYESSTYMGRSDSAVAGT